MPLPGSKPTVLFFFAIECGACVPGTQVLAEVQRSSLRPAYAAVDIAPNETVDEIREFLAGDGAALGFASDSDTRLISAYRISQVSTAMGLNAVGTEAFRAVEPGAAELQTALAVARRAKRSRMKTGQT
ncbi:hypothetical protein [Leucobacter sp. NPDC077196]|uniref:TlpA family protein disulfide reductase n=1 Tax=Leucobacter sp. NPDC077196 TaxID=3154959 RepID=UPI00342D86D1